MGFNSISYFLIYLLLQATLYTQQLLMDSAFASVFALAYSAVCRLVVNDSTSRSNQD
jgi:hypothetical protein